MNTPQYTPAMVERGYNNRAAVVDHPLFLARFAAESAEARARYRHHADLRYGPGAHETLDLFLPTSTPLGTFVFIHGGYWRALDKSDHSFVAGPFVEQGFAVAVINYALCPTVSIAHIVDQCRRAVIWVAREGAAHGANAGNVIVGGHSAGGHLAAMMFCTDWRALGFARAPFVGGVTLSGVHDLTPLVLFSFNADFKLDATSAARLSPVNFAPTTTVPLLIACGAEETSEFLRQSDLLWDAWPQVRRPASTPLFIADTHHFSVVLEYARPESALTQATLGLLR
ncbi:MAG: alpha/beta hydrolase [Betaproteobacteria bacterium]